MLWLRRTRLAHRLDDEACGSWEAVVKNYYAGLTAVDENIGKLFHHLEANKMLDDTAIVQRRTMDIFWASGGCSTSG